MRPRALPLTTALVVRRPPADDAIATSEASARAAAPGGPADSRGWFGLGSMAPARPLQQCCPAEGGCPVTPTAATPARLPLGMESGSGPDASYPASSTWDGISGDSF